MPPSGQKEGALPGSGVGLAAQHGESKDLKMLWLAAAEGPSR